MAETYDFIIAGGGHNGLTAAAYLAKAGQSVIVLEEKSYTGGGVVTVDDYAAPGFKSDLAACCHVVARLSPTMTNDELGLFSKQGLEYIDAPQVLTVVFPDNRGLTFYRDVEKTVESIRKFSEHDANAYREFLEWAGSLGGMLAAGTSMPAPPFGALVQGLSGTPEGRELVRTLYVSAHDLALEWFEDPHVINAIDRYGSENMNDPHSDGSGINVVLEVPSLHTVGISYPVGGSGELSKALERAVKDFGGTVRTNARVVNILNDGERATGVRLADGEEIFTSKAVISSLGIRQLDEEMMCGYDMGEEYYHNLEVLRDQQFQAFKVDLAVDGIPHYICEEANGSAVVEFENDSIEGMRDTFQGYRAGKLNHETMLTLNWHNFDTSKAPEGKSSIYLYQYAPYFVEGGPERWDEIRDEYAQQIIESWCSRTTNITPDKVIGYKCMSPLNFERDFNHADYHGNFNHIGAQISQFLGNRPFAEVSNNRFPLKDFYGIGPSFPNGSAVSCGSRAGIQAVFEDFDMDFDEVCLAEVK